jgi:environmental stress-induced protein Ves
VGETYDWRLSVANMERRDGYFTRLKLRVEMLHQLNKEKVPLLTRGSAVFHQAPVQH